MTIDEEYERLDKMVNNGEITEEEARKELLWMIFERRTDNDE